MSHFIGADVRAVVSDRLRDALRARDRDAVSALRAALHRIDNAGATLATDAGMLSAQQARQMLLNEAQELAEAAVQYAELDQDERAAGLRAQAHVLRTCAEQFVGAGG